MYSFPELIKKIREESNLTQKELADVLSVSTILVSMIEAKQKPVSKNFIIKLARNLEVNPKSITPFLFEDKKFNNKSISNIEKDLIQLGEKLQIFLVKHKSKNLRKYASKKMSVS